MRDLRLLLTKKLSNMKKTILTLIATIFLLPLLAQSKTELIEKNTSQKCKDLVIQLKTRFQSEQNIAETHKMTFSELGKLIANQLINQGLVDEFNFYDLKESCLYNCTCQILAAEYETTEYFAGPKFLNKKDFVPVMSADYHISMPAVDFVKISFQKPSGKFEKESPISGVTCAQYIMYFNSAMSTISQHFGYNYTAWQDEDIAYTVISK